MTASKRLGWSLAALGVGWLALTPMAGAAPVLRLRVDQQGDFALVGNSLAWDCSATGTILTGTVGNCGINTIDTAPDVYWRSDDDTQTALADVSVAPAEARSSANLQLSGWGTPTHAFLFWAGEFLTASYPQNFDDVVTLERIDGGWGDVTDSITVTAESSRYVPQGYHNYFQCSADVTPFIQAYGGGVYRVSGLDVGPLVDRDEQISFAGWFLVVFYEDPYEPLRNLVLFESLDLVGGSLTSTATLSGFYVPNAGYDAKLGVVAYEGDLELTGDGLRFGTAPLAPGDELGDVLNPTDNFFNSSRSWLGASPLAAGDMPLLVGDPDSMAGMDMDVLDITTRVAPTQTTADVEAFSNGDVYVLGAYVTSIATLAPSFDTSSKVADDVNGGTLLPGDPLRYTITVTNTGNDDAVDVVLTDQLPVGVTYQPGSLQIVSGPNAGAKTDAADSDQGEYDGSTRTITVRLGTGADGSAGGTVATGETTVVELVVVVGAGYSGLLSNQGEIHFAGAQGAPASTTLTDADMVQAGRQPTEILAEECDDDAQCAAPDPRCDTAANPNVCVECLADADCNGPNSGVVCDGASSSCTPGCRGTGADGGCPAGEQCTSFDTSIGDCITQGGGGAGGGGALGGAGGSATGGMGGAATGGSSSTGGNAALGGAGGVGGGATGGMGGSATGGSSTGGSDGGSAAGGSAAGGSGASGGTGGTTTGGTGGTATGGTSGTAAGPSGGTDGSIDESGGCGCATPGSRHGREPMGLAALLWTVVMLRRRRSR